MDHLVLLLSLAKLSRPGIYQYDYTEDVVNISLFGTLVPI